MNSVLLTMSIFVVTANSSIRECCEFFERDVKKLNGCLNATTLQTNPTFEVLSTFGPHLLIGIVTRATPEITNYSAYSFLVQTMYAERNAYVSFPLYPDTPVPDYKMHRKLVPLLEALRGYAIDMNYLVWMDAGIGLW